MKERLFSNWTFRRMIYMMMGVYLISQSFIDKQWLGIALGIYFASMGLFAFGCAGGICYGGNCEITPDEKSEIMNNKL